MVLKCHGPGDINLTVTLKKYCREGVRNEILHVNVISVETCGTQHSAGTVIPFSYGMIYKRRAKVKGTICTCELA